MPSNLIPSALKPPDTTTSPVPEVAISKSWFEAVAVILFWNSSISPNVDLAEGTLKSLYTRTLLS